MITHLKTIPTTDAAGEPSGAVVPIWHVDSGRKVDQVYMTTIAPGKSKGPHLHRVRAGAFTVIRGSVRIVLRINGDYIEHDCSGPSYKTVHVPAGVPCCLYNLGNSEAIILNMPTPPWRDNSDEHTVQDWSYPPACAA